MEYVAYPVNIIGRQLSESVITYRSSKPGPAIDGKLARYRHTMLENFSCSQAQPEPKNKRENCVWTPVKVH